MFIRHETDVTLISVREYSATRSGQRWHGGIANRTRNEAEPRQCKLPTCQPSSRHLPRRPCRKPPGQCPTTRSKTSRWIAGRAHNEAPTRQFRMISHASLRGEASDRAASRQTVKARLSVMPGLTRHPLPETRRRLPGEDRLISAKAAKWIAACAAMTPGGLQ